MILYAMYRKNKKTVENIIEEQKIPSELGTTIDHQIIEVVKLGPPESLGPVEAPQLNVVSNNNNNNRNNGNEDGIYTIEIRNVNQEMIEKIKKLGAVGAAAPPNLVTVAA